MNVWSFLQTIIPAIITFIAGLVGVRYGSSKNRLEKNKEFRHKQLNEFYSPIYGLYLNINEMNKLSRRISDEAGTVWREIAERHEGDYNWSGDEEFESFSAIINYDNKQLTQDIIPLYKEMFSLFKNNFYLIEDSTRKFYKPLYEFIELWERWLSEAIPRNVMVRVGHDGTFMQQLGNEIIETIDKLRSDLLQE